MKNARILLLEDEVLVAADIKYMLEQSGFEVVGHVASGQEVSEMARTLKPDVALLDIEVQGPVNGIEAGRRIREEFGTPIIYLTKLDETYNMAKETAPHDFLPKPVDPERLKRSIELAVKSHQTNPGRDIVVEINGVVYIKDTESKTRMNFDDILYFEADGSYCNIQSKVKRLMLSRSMGNVLDALHQIKGGERFLQVNRSQAVNIHHVNKIQGNMLLIEDKTFHIGPTYREKVLPMFPSI